MTAILDFFSAIASGLQAIVDFVLSLIEDIAYTAQILATFVAQVPQYLSFIPAPVLSVITSMFIVVVIYKILGRD